MRDYWELFTPFSITKKGRTEEDLITIIQWLTGYSRQEITHYRSHQSTCENFFANATIHPNAKNIMGSICGYDIASSEKLLSQRKLIETINW